MDEDLMHIPKISNQISNSNMLSHLCELMLLPVLLEKTPKNIQSNQEASQLQLLMKITGLFPSGH